MSEFFQRNAEILQARWPSLFPRLAREDSGKVQAVLTEGRGSTLSVEGIQLTSRHDRLAEARFQASSLPESLSLIHI